MPSPQVQFRARPPLDKQMEVRRTYPDILNDYRTSYSGDDQYPIASLNSVAARDISCFYRLIDAELADAALTRDEAMIIVDSLLGLATDFRWVTEAPDMLAAEIENAHGDDEDGPDPERTALADRVRGWPRLRAYAVTEAALAVVTSPDETDLDTALTTVGLLRTERRRRR